MPGFVLDTGNKVDKDKILTRMEPKVKCWIQTVNKETVGQLIPEDKGKLVIEGYL